MYKNKIKLRKMHPHPLHPFFDFDRHFLLNSDDILSEVTISLTAYRILDLKSQKTSLVLCTFMKQKSTMNCL